MKQTWNKMEAFVFRQPNALTRLALLRRSVAAVVLINMCLGPFTSFYAENADLLWTPGGVLDLSHLPYGALRAARLVLVVLCTGILLGLRPRLLSLVAGMVLLGVDYYLYRFDPAFWNFQNHLMFFLFLLATVDTRTTSRQGAWPSFVLTAAQLYIAVLYFQSGLSKVWSAGWTWVATGRTIAVSTLLYGTDFGRYWLRYPQLLPLLAGITIAFEMGFIVAYSQRRWHPVLGVFAMCFHIGIWALMGIPFWQLWALYPALFVCYNNNGKLAKTPMNGLAASPARTPPRLDAQPVVEISGR